MFEKVTIEYSRSYSAKPADWDGVAASAKHLIDACVKLNLIEDDDPSIVQSFTVYQDKRPRKEQQTKMVLTECHH